jgi:hypothetical protein
LKQPDFSTAYGHDCAGADDAELSIQQRNCVPIVEGHVANQHGNPIAVCLKSCRRARLRNCRSRRNRVIRGHNTDTGKICIVAGNGRARHKRLHEGNRRGDRANAAQSVSGAGQITVDDFLRVSQRLFSISKVIGGIRELHAFADQGQGGGANDHHATQGNQHFQHGVA